MKHFAGFAVLVAVAAVLGMPGRISAIQPTLCDAPPLIAASPTASAQLGWSLSADGYWLAAGALQDNAKTGSVALYKNPGTRPDPHPDQEITAGDPHPGDQFGASVSISGTWLAVGAPGKAQNSGAVYLFKFDGTSWVQMAPTLSAADAAPGAQFGFSVSLVGSRLVVGAPGDSDRGSLAGSAYVFEMHGNSWNLTKELHADADGRPFDEFGFAVATFDDQIVVGAPFADDLTLFKNFGAAYVFDNPGVASNGWSQAAKLPAEGGFRGDNIQFGASVALSAKDTMGIAQIVVGVPGDDLQNRTDSGSAYVFKGSGVTWNPTPLTPEDPGAGEQFGSAVLIDVEGSVVIGSRFDGEDGPKAGAAYLFQNNPGWTQMKKYVRPAPGAAYGQSVARLNGQVFMGGYLDDVGLVVDAGSVAVCPGGPPVPKPDLICTKKGPTSVEAGDLVTYTIQVTNRGGAAATGVKLTDQTPDGLTLVSVGGACDKLPCLLNTIGAGAPPLSVKVTFRVPDGCAAPRSIENTAKGQDDGNHTFSCNLSSPTPVIRPGPSLSCSKQGPSTAQPGDTVTYDIAVSNSGCEGAKNVILSDPTPAGLSLVSVSGPCTQFPCNLGTIPPGETLPPVKTAFNVSCAASGQTVENIAMVGGAECTAQTQIVPAHLVLVSNGPAAPVACGTSFSFSLTASNLGSADVKDAVLEVTAVGALSLTSGVPGCVPVTTGPQPALLCSGLPELLHNGSSDSITFSAQAPACGCSGDCGTVTINATVRSVNSCSQADLVPSLVIPITCSPIADLAITKTHGSSVLAPGQPITYTLTVSNSGPCDVPSATVHDPIPAPVLNPQCTGANASDCAISGNTVTIQVGPLAAHGAAVSYQIEGQLPLCFASFTNKATVTPPPGITDPDLSNNTAQDLPVPPSPPGVSIQCSGVSGAFEGDYVTFTYVLSNGGTNAQGDNPGAEFMDTVPAGLTLVTAIASSGTVTTAANTVSWNGSIPACGTVTIAVQVKVNSGTMGMTICNQGVVAFDANGDGINESNANATCCVTILPSPPPPFVPTLSGTGLAALTILLACVALLRLRRRSL